MQTYLHVQYLNHRQKAFCFAEGFFNNHYYYLHLFLFYFQKYLKVLKLFNPLFLTPSLAWSQKMGIGFWRKRAVFQAFNFCFLSAPFPAEINFLSKKFFTRGGMVLSKQNH